VKRRKGTRPGLAKIIFNILCFVNTLISKYIKKAKHTVFTPITLTFRVRMLWKLKASERSGDLYRDPLTHLYSYTLRASVTVLHRCHRFCSLQVLQQKAQVRDVF